MFYDFHLFSKWRIRYVKPKPILALIFIFLKFRDKSMQNFKIFSIKRLLVSFQILILNIYCFHLNFHFHYFYFQALFNIRGLKESFCVVKDTLEILLVLWLGQSCTHGQAHEVYAAPICVPVCKWYINCNNRQLANSSTTLDKASFSSTWLQPLAIMTSRIVFMKHIQGNDKFSLTIIIIIPYEPLPLRLVIR